MSGNNRYKYERIGSPGFGRGHYRVFDSLNDDQIATCYQQENAELIVKTLNEKHASEPGFDPEGVRNGAYKIYWKDGTHSIASVGRDAHGGVWFCPANWTSGPSYDWATVVSVTLISESET